MQLRELHLGYLISSTKTALNFGCAHRSRFTIGSLSLTEYERFTLVTAVELLEKAPSHLYRMHLGGYLWMFWVGKRVTAAVQRFSLKANGKLRILAADGRPVIDQLTAVFHTLPPPKN
jgi:hypothetical protein